MVKCECPSCFFEFELDDKTREEDYIRCPDCSVDLEIVKIDSDLAKAEIAEAVEEYWGD